MTTQGVLFPDGTLLPSATLCDYEPGSTLYFRFSDGSESPYIGPLPPTPEKKMEPTPIEPALPEAAHQEAAPAIEAAPQAPAAATQATPAPTETLAASTGADSDLGIALGAGQILKDNPWAPLVMLALAAIGVLGGKKAWSFYSDRSAQQHELELKKLDIQEKQAKHQQPPACLLRDAEHEAKLVALDQKISALDAKVSGLEKGLDLGDFDMDDLKKFDRRLKKIEKSLKDDNEDKE